MASKRDRNRQKLEINKCNTDSNNNKNANQHRSKTEAKDEELKQSFQTGTADKASNENQANSSLLEKKLQTRDTNSMDEYSKLEKRSKSKDEQIVKKTHI